MLNRTPASGLQYRLFRLFAFGALALGADSLLVTAGTLPSGAYGSTYGRDDTCPPLSDKAALWKHWETYGESARDCYYDAAEVAEHNGVSFLDWLNRSIARPAASAAEATCNFTQTGVDFATTSTAGTLLSHISTTASATTTPPSLATLVGRDYALDRSTGEYTAYGRTREEEAVVTPIVKYHGRLCDLLPAAGVSRASRKFETTYSAAFAATSGASGVASADLDPRVFGEAHIGLEGNAAGGAIYEGRSVAPHPMNVGLTALSPAIMVSLSPAFLGQATPTRGYQVKVMFAHPSAASSTSLGIQYWCGSAETRIYATYDALTLTANKVYTASFSVPASCLLAMPSATAPSGAHLAVLADGGAPPDILTVRVIRDE